MDFLKKYKIQLIAILVGGILGYTYYAQVGCVSGTCAITSSPYISTLYGALLAYLFVGMFIKEPVNKKNV